MNYGTVKHCDIANGPGVRTSLFVSGCRIHCKGCFNAETWDFDYGSLFTPDVERAILESMGPAYIAGLTVLGGEPMEEENQRALLPFLRDVRRLYPHKTIWCYSGYTLDKLLEGGAKHCEATSELLSLIDVLVEGPFMEELYDITLRFCGSSNQRIIDMPATLEAWAALQAAQGEASPRDLEPVLWEDEPVYSTHTM